MFYTPTTAPERELMPGVFMKVLTYGAETMLCEFHLAAGSLIPLHHHPQEQSGYLVAGRLRFFGDEGELIVEAGSGWTFRGGVSHGAEVLRDAVAIELFAPLREDYLP
jgi:quercetin dioxygenase-like cupin family protein